MILGYHLRALLLGKAFAFGEALLTALLQILSASAHGTPAAQAWAAAVRATRRFARPT